MIEDRLLLMEDKIMELEEQLNVFCFYNHVIHEGIKRIKDYNVYRNIRTGAKRLTVIVYNGKWNKNHSKRFQKIRTKYQKEIQ